MQPFQVPLLKAYVAHGNHGTWSMPPFQVPLLKAYVAHGNHTSRWLHSSHLLRPEMSATVHTCIWGPQPSLIAHSCRYLLERWPDALHWYAVHALHLPPAGCVHTCGPILKPCGPRGGPFWREHHFCPVWPEQHRVIACRALASGPEQSVDHTVRGTLKRGTEGERERSGPQDCPAQPGQYRVRAVCTHAVVCSDLMDILVDACGKHIA